MFLQIQLNSSPQVHNKWEYEQKLEWFGSWALKAWVVSKEFLCNGWSQKATFSSHCDFWWQEACGWDRTCHDHLQPHVLLRHCVCGKMTVLQGCSCAQAWAPRPSTACPPSPACGHQTWARNVQKCMKGEGCLFSCHDLQGSRHSCALEALASQYSREHFLATARCFGLKMR